MNRSTAEKKTHEYRCHADAAVAIGRFQRIPIAERPAQTFPELHASSITSSPALQELLPLILTADFSANDFNISTTIRTNIRAMYFA
jgi:hypothetical protein